jgi:hypothetical protein
MEPKFQTSFIPKKTPTPIGGFGGQKAVRQGTSIYLGLAVILFVVSLAATGAAYAWKQYLIGQQASYKQELADREKQFNTQLITDLKQVNVQIDTAKQLLSSHLALSQIFEVISKLTIEKVRFVSMDVTLPGAAQLAMPGTTNAVAVKMQGYGSNLSSVAFQSKVLSQLEQYGLRQIVKNPIISDPSLEPTGAVSFGFAATIDPGSLSYRESVSPSSQQSQQPPSTGQGQTR